ncbi:hypothetical protein ACJX0J_014676, partial [Zea mays]
VFANGEMSKLLFTRIDEHVLIFLFFKHPFCKILVFYRLFFRLQLFSISVFSFFLYFLFLFPHTSQQIIINPFLFLEEHILHDTRGVTMEEKLGMFLFMLSYNASYEYLQHEFKHSGETIHRHIQSVFH